MATCCSACLVSLNAQEGTNQVKYADVLNAKNQQAAIVVAWKKGLSFLFSISLHH
jgi:hypothetical protein